MVIEIPDLPSECCLPCNEQDRLVWAMTHANRTECQHMWIAKHMPNSDVLGTWILVNEYLMSWLDLVQEQWPGSIKHDNYWLLVDGVRITSSSVVSSSSIVQHIKQTRG